MATVTTRNGRTFKIERTKSGDIRGLVISERVDECWDCVSGTHRTMSEACRDLDRIAGS